MILPFIYSLSLLSMEATPRVSDRFEYSSQVSINYEVHGNGSQTVLLIHGYGASLQTWKDIQPLLVDSLRLYILDLKGFGLSSKPFDNSYSIDDQADIVRAFIEEMKLSNLVLGGHSYGGAVALVTYFKLEDKGIENRIKSLILIDSAGYLQKFPFFISILRIPIINWLILKTIPAYWRAKYTLKRIFYNPAKVTGERVYRYAQFFDMPGSHHAFIEVAKQIVPSNPDTIIRRIRMIDIPTLIVWGKNDPVIPLEHAYRFQKEIVNSKLQIIPECGHVSHEEKPQKTALAIRKFLF